MSDYITLRTRIADELANDGAVTDAQIAYAIQDTIKIYERRPWWFNNNSTTFSTVANQEYYTSVEFSDLTNTVAIIAMTITYSSVKQAVVPIDFQSIDSAQNGYVVSVPRLYAYFDQSIRFFPIPSDAYTITVSYITRLTALSADADTNAWTNEAEELIRQGAKRRIAMNYFHAEDVAARCATMEQEAYSALLAEDRRRHPNTELRGPGILDRKRFNIIAG